MIWHRENGHKLLRLPSIYLAVHLHAVSYVIAAGLTVLFAVLVQGRA